MKLHRIAGFVVLVILLAAVLVGCTPTTSPSASPSASNPSGSVSVAPTEAPTPKPIVTYTFYRARPLQATIPGADTPIGKAITEITRARVEVEYLVGQDYKAKSGTMIAGGLYPDMIDAAVETAGDFIDAGACIALDDLLNKYGEQIKKIFKPQELELMAMDRGKIYMIPNTRPAIDNLYPAAGYYLNYDILKANNFPKVTKLSQYGQLIKDYLKANPKWNNANNIGWTLPTDGGRGTALEYGGARFTMGYPNDGVTAVNQDTLEAKLVQNQPELKDFCKFMNDLWRNNAMDKETFMQKDDAYLAKISSGNLLGIYDQRWGITNGIAAAEKPAKEGEKSVADQGRALVAFPIIVDSAKRDYYRGPYALQAIGIAISIKAKDPDGVMQYLNAFASDEVGKLIHWGIEGTDYTKGADGKFTRTEDQWKKAIDTEYQKSQGLSANTNFMGPYREGTGSEQYGYFEDGNIVNPNLLPEYGNVKYKAYEKQILTDYKINFLTDFFAPAYSGFYTPGYTIIQTSLKADSAERQAADWVNQTAREYHAKLAQAKDDAAFDSIWTEYRAKLATKAEAITSLEKVVTEKVKATSEYYK